MENMFEKTIKVFLDEKAENDSVFAEKYKTDGKTIQDCCKYIIAEVKKNCKGNDAACTDDYVYGLAVHFFDEDDIKAPTNVPSCSVVVTRELTDKEKEEAKEEALRRLKEKEIENKMAEEKKRQEAIRKRKIAEEERRKKEMGNDNLLFSFE